MEMPSVGAAFHVEHEGCCLGHRRGLCRLLASGITEVSEHLHDEESGIRNHSQIPISISAAQDPLRHAWRSQRSFADSF